MRTLTGAGVDGTRQRGASARTCSRRELPRVGARRNDDAIGGVPERAHQRDDRAGEGPIEAVRQHRVDDRALGRGDSARRRSGRRMGSAPTVDDRRRLRGIRCRVPMPTIARAGTAAGCSATSRLVRHRGQAAGAPRVGRRRRAALPSTRAEYASRCRRHGRGLRHADSDVTPDHAGGRRRQRRATGDSHAASRAQRPAGPARLWSAGAVPAPRPSRVACSWNGPAGSRQCAAALASTAVASGVTPGRHAIRLGGPEQRQ